MNLHLANKNAIVLGGSKGIGFAIAKNLLAEGANVLIVSRDQELLNKHKLAYKNIQILSLDLSKVSAVSELFKFTEEKFPNIDILINNTGGPPMLNLNDITETAWMEHFRSLFLNFIDCSKKSADIMKRNGWGRIITILSSGVLQPIPGLALSNSLRSAFRSWAKSFSEEVAPYNITVNNIIPGKIETERLKKIDIERAEKNGISLEEQRKLNCALISLGRYGTPSEVANLTAFLASESASYITGTSILIDGGLIKNAY